MQEVLYLVDERNNNDPKQYEGLPETCFGSLLFLKATKYNTEWPCFYSSKWRTLLFGTFTIPTFYLVYIVHKKLYVIMTIKIWKWGHSKNNLNNYSEKTEEYNKKRHRKKKYEKKQTLAKNRYNLKKDREFELEKRYETVKKT